MSSLGDILAAQSKLEARQKASRTIPLIDQVIRQLEGHRRDLASQTPSTASESLRLNVKTVADHFRKEIMEDQKEMYNIQSKLGKAIAKRFKVDMTAATDPAVFSGKSQLINEAIALNFVRQGQFDIAESFAREARLEIDASLMAQFRTMYTITSRMDEGDLLEAIQWALHHRQALQARGSTLEFELHRAQYIRIFKSSDVFEIIAYARDNFAAFADRHLKEIQKLMSAVAFHSSIATSPYSHLFLETNLINNAKQSFVTEFTALLSMTPTRPLQTTIEAADLALPTLMKLSALKVAARQGASVDLPLPKELRFHSVFVCPVTKEIGGEAWMLGCGHVIGGDAMHSLSKGTPKLKCPYCPVVSEVSSGVRLIF